MLLQTVIITACDLCASAKPWDIQLQTVHIIFDEFYLQVYTQHAMLYFCMW